MKKIKIKQPTQAQIDFISDHVRAVSKPTPNVIVR